MKAVRRRGRRGSAAVELALTLPLIITMLSGLWEMGRALEVQNLLANGAREAARQASTGQYTNAQVQQIALNYIKAGLNDTNGTLTTHLSVTVTNLNSPGSDATAAVSLDPIQVSVSIPFKDVRWINLPLVTSDATMLSTAVTWICLKDVAYPTTTPQPPTG
jgi:Flp pilus assembly protein TadG